MTGGLARAASGQQPQLPGALHGRGAVIDLELGVDPAEMRADGVHRDGQLAGDLRPGQVRRQIPLRRMLRIAALAQDLDALLSELQDRVGDELDRACCDLSRRCHAVDAAAGEYRSELRGQIELTT
jgi:hypothetical protein